jgi:putative GTP pyrophosphokinase
MELLFKNKNWEGLLRNKFRLKFQVSPLKKELLTILNDNVEIGKQIFRLDREELLIWISRLNISVPINLNNILYLINLHRINESRITDITPQYILDQ